MSDQHQLTLASRRQWMSRNRWARRLAASGRGLTTPLVVGRFRGIVRCAFALPLGVLAAVLLGLVLLLVVFLSGRRTPPWTRVVGACLLLPALLGALFAGVNVSEYHDFAGTDATSSMGHPCGFG